MARFAATHCSAKWAAAIQVKQTTSPYLEADVDLDISRGVVATGTTEENRGFAVALASARVRRS
jgi:hypothetical protein